MARFKVEFGDCDLCNRDDVHTKDRVCGVCWSENAVTQKSSERATFERVSKTLLDRDEKRGGQMDADREQRAINALDAILSPVCDEIEDLVHLRLKAEPSMAVAALGATIAKILVDVDDDDVDAFAAKILTDVINVRNTEEK